MLSFQTRGKGELENERERWDGQRWDQTAAAARCSHIWAGPVLCCTILYSAHHYTLLTPTPGHQVPVIRTGGGTSLMNIIIRGHGEQPSIRPHYKVTCSSNAAVSGLFCPCCYDWDWVTKIRRVRVSQWMSGDELSSHRQTQTVQCWGGDCDHNQDIMSCVRSEHTWLWTQCLM